MTEGTSSSKKKEDENLDSGVSKILYIGEDKTFFGNLEQKYREIVTSTDCIFEQVFAQEESEIQSFVLKVREEKPKHILIDFSKNDKAFLHLARVIARQNKLRPIKIIGLCEYKQAKTHIFSWIIWFSKPGMLHIKRHCFFIQLRNKHITIKCHTD